jgi:diamine N-acetyltransferase
MNKYRPITPYSIRPLEHRDGIRMLEWMKDPDIMRFFRFSGESMKLSDTIAFIDKSKNDNSNIHFAISDGNDNYCGTVSLKNVGNDSAEYAICLHPDSIGSGAAKSGTISILDYGFNILELESIYLNVLEQNTRAVRFYEKFGFRTTHTSSTTFDDREATLIWYEMRRDEWRNGHS